MPVYVQHEVLGKVGDVFDAESIWQAPGLALFSRRPLLRDLLERTPREQRGRAATRCFSHITVMLPQEEVDDDRHLTRGTRARDLADTLKALHQKDFGDLLGSDEVRYDVIGTSELHAGDIEVKFGHAVYLPGSGEHPLHQVSASRDGASWKPVCAIYPSQRLALLGHDAHQASYAIPGWPFGQDGGLLLINDGPEAPVEIQVRPKDAFDCQFDALNGYYAIKSRTDGQRLLLKVTRVAASAPAAPAAVWKTRAQPDATAVPPSHRPAPNVAAEATFAPLAQARATLVALALPRLSRYRETATDTLELGFDRHGAIASGAADMAARLSITAQDELFIQTADSRQRIGIPSSFALDAAHNLHLTSATGELAERYLALLSLPTPLSAPTGSGTRHSFGRAAPALARLRVLDSARFLTRADGLEAGSVDRLGLSRMAFSFEGVDGGFQVCRLAPGQALFHLDEKLRLVGMVGEEPSLIPSGHHLVAGHYVLRFDA